jgi:hypothetical protein
MLTRFRSLACLAFLVTVPSRAQVPEVPMGARVRVTAPSATANKYVGIVSSQQRDTLTLRRYDRSSIAIPTSAVTSLDLHRGKNRTKGALWGAAAGLILGGILGLVSASAEKEPCFCPTDAQVTVLTAGAGALTGGAVGALFGTDRWERVYGPDRNTTSSSVAPTRPRLALRFAFYSPSRQ